MERTLAGWSRNVPLLGTPQNFALLHFLLRLGGKYCPAYLVASSPVSEVSERLSRYLRSLSRARSRRLRNRWDPLPLSESPFVAHPPSPPQNHMSSLSAPSSGGSHPVR